MRVEILGYIIQKTMEILGKSRGRENKELLLWNPRANQGKSLEIQASVLFLVEVVGIHRLPFWTPWTLWECTLGQGVKEEGNMLRAFLFFTIPFWSFLGPERGVRTGSRAP